MNILAMGDGNTINVSVAYSDYVICNESESFCSSVSYS